MRVDIYSHKNSSAAISVYLMVEEGGSLPKVTPLDAAAQERMRAQVEELQGDRQRWLAPQADLQTVASDLEALRFSEAEAKIRAEEEMLRSLNEEVEAAEKSLQQAREERDKRKSDEQSAEAELRTAEANLQTCESRLRDLEAQLAETGIEDASDEALDRANDAAAKARSEYDHARRERLTAAEKLAGLKPQVEAAEDSLKAATKERRDQEAQAGPAVARWTKLRARCAELGLLDAALGDASLEEVAGKASVDVFQLRQRWWALMVDRVEAATGGEPLRQTLREIMDASAEAGSEQYLRAWLETRAWLAERVPKHVSEVEDPVDALHRLRRHLDRLVDKLERSEHRLRGDSRDVARAIEGRLRKVNPGVARRRVA